MPAYIIAQMQVHDIETYRDYAAKVPPTVAAFDDKILAASDTAEVREGTQPYPRTVILEFPDMEAARAWYESGDYQSVLPLRLKSTTGTVFMIEGFPRPEATGE